MKGIDPPRFITVEFLLAFLFCGAVVGETISLSIVVTTFGPDIVGKLYLVNASILLLVPLLFFRHIDRIDRSRLLANLLIITNGAITAVFLLYQLSRQPVGTVSYLIVFLYPVAYLSKTVLFLTFWTFLNDIYSIQEAKKRFPVVAAWGFAGALCGVFVARLLIVTLSASAVIVLWITVYLVAWVYTRKIGLRFVKKLQPGEDIPGRKKTFFGVGDLLSIPLVRTLAIFYFITFLTVFTLDFLFWKSCCQWFRTSEAVASFLFSFYPVHAIVTILLLRYALPKIIDRFGITRILYGLPVIFVAGGSGLLFIQGPNLPPMSLPLFVVIQFFRYLFFEITFAPSFQMFFTAIVKEQRGRSKTLLDGIVKPAAIFTSGFVLVCGSNRIEWLLALIVSNGFLLCFVVYLLRRVYRTTVMHESTAPVEMDEIIEEVGQRADDSLYRLIGKYALAREYDLRMVAIHLLKQLGTDQALTVLEKMYEAEHDLRLKEMIARSMNVFFGYRTKIFIERLLHENNHRIKANAIYAINQMHCNWKKHLKQEIAPLLFENNRRVQLEAARFLWRYGTSNEKNTVSYFLKNLLNSQNTDRRSAGLYLAGSIQSPGWEEVLLSNLNTASLQVYSKSIEVIFNIASDEVMQKTLERIDSLSRRHISIAGKIMEREGQRLRGMLSAFLPRARNRRLIFEIVACMRKIADTIRASGASLKLTKEAIEVIQRWIQSELQIVYHDAFHFYRMRETARQNPLLEMLESALREKQTRLCGWALSAMVLSDTKGIVNWRHADMNINEIEQRIDLIEAFESVAHERTGLLVLPLLKQETWGNLSKIGNTYFHFNHDRRKHALRHFLTSENVLTALSALYIVDKNLKEYAMDMDIEEALVMLKQGKNELIATAAIDLLERRTGAAISRGKAFELLENMLFIKQTPLFHTISADKLLRLVEIARRVVYQQDDIVSEEGRVADQLYIVRSGSMRVERTDGGRRLLVAIVKRGETYGEVGLFSRAVRETSAIAQERSEIYIIKGSDIRRLVKETPDVALNLLEVISKRLFQSGRMVKKSGGERRVDSVMTAGFHNQ